MNAAKAQGVDASRRPRIFRSFGSSFGRAAMEARDDQANTPTFITAATYLPKAKPPADRRQAVAADSHSANEGIPRYMLNEVEYIRTFGY